MSVYEDSLGFLWIGTQQGLFMFDGASLIAFSRSRGAAGDLPVSDVRGIFEDTFGNLVIATFGGGIYRLDRNSSSFRKVAFEGHKELQFINRIIQLNQKFFVLLSDSGVAFLDSNLKRIPHVSQLIQELGGIDHFMGAALSQRNGILIGMDSGLYSLANDLSNVEKVYTPSPGARITSFSGTRSQRTYFTTSQNTLNEFDLDTRSIAKSIHLGERLFTNVTNIAVHSSYIWVGTDQGLIHVDSNFSKAALNDKATSELFSDHILTLYSTDRTLWAGTYSGLNTISRSAFHTFTEDNKIPIGDVLSFVELEDGTMLIGTYEGLYSKAKNFDEHHKVMLPSSDLASDVPIMALSRQGSTIWLGLWKLGVFIWDIERNTIKPAPLPDNSNLAVTSILHDSTGETWIGTYNQGVFRIGAAGKNVTGYLTDTPVIKMLQLDRGSILSLSTNEIYIYNQKKDEFSYQSINFEGYDTSPLITSIQENSEGELLVGTKDSGLFTWNYESDRTKRAFPQELLNLESTSHLTINGIEEGPQGEIWCTTQNGVIRIGRDGKFIASFSKAHGLQGDDFNSGSSFKDRFGNLYFGGPNGYTFFHPNDVVEQSSVSAIFIASMQIFGNESRKSYNVARLDSLVLAHSNYLVKFAFALRDFVDPEKHQYRYKLEGFDPDWIENGNRNTATYTNLPAGDYVFRVIGANSAGIWNEDGVRLAVKVLPPPWQTWWAYCFYAIGLIGLFWIGKKFYDTYAVKEQAVKMAEDMIATAHRVEDELQYQQEFQDEMVQEIYRHNLDTLELLKQSAMSGPEIEGEHVSGQSTRLQRQVDILSLLEANYFYQPEGLLANLNQFTDALISRLLPEASVPVESITTVNKVPHTLIPAHVASPIALVLSELLENALLHAFNADSPANYIEIELANTDIDGAGAGYRLTVSDTGCGLPPGVSPASATTPGLALIRGLAAHTRGSFTLSSDEGCVATFSLPLDQETPR